MIYADPAIQDATLVDIPVCPTDLELRKAAFAKLNERCRSLLVRDRPLPFNGGGADRDPLLRDYALEARERESDPLAQDDGFPKSES